MTIPALDIHHNRSATRFEAMVEDRLCVAEYRVHDGVMAATRTFVPPPLEGRGIAAALVAAALAYARINGLQVRPACSYVARYMHRHPDTLDLLDAED